MAVVTNVSVQTWDRLLQSEVLYQGLRKSDMSGRCFVQVLIFCKTDAGSNILRQFLDTRLESEALAMACQTTIFQDGLRTRRWFFSKMGVVTKNLAQGWDSTWKSEVPATGWKRMNMFIQAAAPALVFLQNLCGSKSFRLDSEHETGK